MEVADSTLKCLKSLRHLAKRSSAKRQEYGKLCLLLFGPKYGDTEFMAALTDDMGFDSINDFLAFINFDVAEMKAGRPMTDKLLRLKMVKTKKLKIYSQHIKLMYQNFLKENPDAKASPSLYYRCKHFYISPANIREMEGCLCAKCLNPHSLYDCLRKHINNFPLSLTQYLTEGFECT